MKESSIERRVVNYAKLNGWLTYKFTSPSHRGVPDRIFMKNSVVLFVEFKRARCCATSLQRYEILRILEQGCNATTVCSVSDGIRLLESYEVPHKITADPLLTVQLVDRGEL